MISGSSSVLFLFLVPIGVISMEITKECGENIEFTPCDNILTCDPNEEIIEVSLKIKNDNTWTDVEPHCSDNEKFCVRFREDRKQMNLVVHSVTFEVGGQYTLRIVRKDGKIQPVYFRIIVKGVCEPKLSGTDNLKCEVDVESTYKPTIVWMDKHRKVYKEKYSSENDTKLEDSFKLTDETREMEMCCTVSYEKEGKLQEKQNCRSLSSPVGTDKLIDKDNKEMIFISSLCVLGLACGVAVYIFRRRRMSTQKNRERTLSGTSLMEGHQAENMEGELSEPLQTPPDQV